LFQGGFVGHGKWFRRARPGYPRLSIDAGRHAHLGSPLLSLIDHPLDAVQLSAQSLSYFRLLREDLAVMIRGQAEGRHSSDIPAKRRVSEVLQRARRCRPLPAELVHEAVGVFWSAEAEHLVPLVAFNSFWLLVGSTLFGSLILEFFGISIPVVRVAGGMLVTAMGWKLLNEGAGASHEPLHDAADAGAANDSFYPLTLPLTVGPGAISVALTIGSHHPSDPFGAHAMMLATAALFGLLAIALAIYGSYRFAVPLVRYIGEAGVNVLVRLSAFILVCIGIRIGWSGLSALVAGLQHPVALP
jgi:multiple antibiotic resistance protein